MRKERTIPLLRGLPAIPRDFAEFVYRALRDLKNEHGEVIGVGSIADVTRSLGFSSDRVGGSGRSTEYLKIRIALFDAERRGLVEHDGQRWWVKGA